MTALQEKILDLLKDIDKLCRENGVEYYLVGGSLIGALRHKGFIPWDDDADIIMTRDNWLNFIQNTKGKIPSDIIIDCQYKNDDADAVIDHTINHYMDTTTTQIYRYNVTRKLQAGVLIDIVIMDPVPDNPDIKELYRQQVSEYSDLVVKPYFYSIRTGKPNNYVKDMKRIKTLGQKKVLDKLGEEIFNYSEEESQLYAQRFAAAPHFWPKEVFGKPKYVQFEDTMLPIPEHAEECLCIGYDDEWFYVPRGGVTKSQHDFCVCDLNIPGKIIGDDYSNYVDYNEMSDVYLKWKKTQAKYSTLKVNKTLDDYKFAAERVRLIYKNKMVQIDYKALLTEKNYEALEEFFEDYIKIQCTHIFLGSSALTGWISWYRKCNPYLIDIGDDALYTVLCLFVHKQKLAFISKLLKARKAVERPLTEQLKSIDLLYFSIKQITYAYDSRDDKKARELVDKYLPQYPDNPFLLKFDLKLKIRQGISNDAVIEKTDKLLENFPGDAEFMYFKADALLKNGETEDGLNLFNEIAEFTNHGIVLLNMKETVAAMFEEDPYNEELAELWLKIRGLTGEEELPELEDIVLKEEHTDEAIADDADNQLTENISTDDDGNESDADDEIDDVDIETLKSEYIRKTQLNEHHQLTDIQEKRLELLCELKGICQKNKIRYYLFSKGLLQAARSNEYIDENGDLTVVMTPDNCEKFMRAVKEENRADRFLDSMYDNPKFHRFCVRYGNTETLDFLSSQCINPNCGIFVTVEILRNPAAGKFRNLTDQMLEAGWETRNTMKWTSIKRKLSCFLVCVLCFFIGEKGAGRWLFKRFMMGAKKKTKGRYYLKPFWGKRTYFPAIWFSYMYDIVFENNTFTTIKPYELYLKQIFGAKWKTRKFPFTKENHYTRIVDAEISSKEYLAHLQSSGIDVKEVFKHKQKTDRKYAPAMTIGAQTSRYWDIMCMCGERHKLYEKYIPQKLYIIELFRSNDIKMLMEVLDDYYKTALLYSKKGLGMLFDEDIFNILEYCLTITGKGKQAAMLKRLHTAQDKNPIVLPNVKEEKGMRVATAQDIPAILTYLKRNLSDCLYMYIDIAKYGLENPNMKIWLDSDDNGITFVMMKYYSGISIQAADNAFDPEEIARIVKEEGATVIRGKKSIVEKIEPLCNNFKAEYGYVFKFTNYRYDDFDCEVETAYSKDTLEIANLIRTNEELGSYFDVKGLAKQLSERIETQMGRSLIIRENDKIVAHIATYAEFENLAVTSALIVAPDSQNGIYGSILEGDLVRQLWGEGFEVYTFIIKRLRKKLLETMGNKCVGEFGRLYKDAGNE